MKPIKASLALAIVLTGCTSFNTLHIGPGILIAPGPIPEPIIPVQEVAVQKLVEPPKKVEDPEKVMPKKPEVIYDLQLLCPAFKFHTIPDTPILPINDLGKIDIHDPKAVNRILYKHIDELRQHMAKLKNQMTLDRRAYNKQCELFHDQNK